MTPHLVSLAALIVLAVGASAGTIFNFAGATWDQENVGDEGVALPIGPGTLFDRSPGSNLPVDFPSGGGTFETSNTFGAMILGGVGATSLVLPDGGQGSINRAGLAVSWSGGRALPNLLGNDFVIYEAASNISDPEAMMVRVLDDALGTYSPWIYLPPVGFQLTSQGPGGTGAYSFIYDLSDFGIAPGAEVSEIQIANMTGRDRMVDALGVGEVIPDDDGATSANLPNPGGFGGGAPFDDFSLDPDPFLLAALHAVPEPSALAFAMGALVFLRRRR